MNKVGLSILAVLSLLVGSVALVSADQENELLLDSFEGALTKETVDFGAHAESVLTAQASKAEKSCGEQSLKISYQLNAGGYMFCARGHGLDVAGALWEGPQPDKIQWSDFVGIKFMLNNATSTGTAAQPAADPTQIAFDVKDAGGEMWRYAVTSDRKGWVEVAVPLTQFKVRDDWQPATADGNRQLDFPLQSFQWEPKSMGEGTLFVDCVKLYKN